MDDLSRLDGSSVPLNTSELGAGGLIFCVPRTLGTVLGRIFQGRGYAAWHSHVNEIFEGTFKPPANTNNGVIVLWAGYLQQKGCDYCVSGLTQLRIDRTHPYWMWPIIILGVDSHISFLRSLQAPRILVSPGIEYIQLPCDLALLTQTVECIEAPRQVNIQDYIQDHSRIKCLEDKVSHDIGNFYALFRLLEGAYLSGELDRVEYQRVREQIQGIQREYLPPGKNIAYQEFLFQREIESRSGRSEHQSSQLIPIMSSKKVLLIDDAAGLGWAHVLSFLLFGDTNRPTITSHGETQILIWENLIAIGRAKPIDVAGEDHFVDDISKGHYNLCARFLSEVDLVLLDLRLRRQKDEGLPISLCSGTRVLRDFRRINAGVPVVLLTASQKARSLAEVIQQGATDYFIKDSGDQGDSKQDVTSYYEEFAAVIRRAVSAAYLRDIWKSIESLKVSKEVKGYLRQAFGLIRQRPSKFEMSLCYSPYAATVVALGAAIEKHVGFQERGAYADAIRKYYARDFWGYSWSLHLGFLRNAASHSIFAHLFTEKDAKIAFIIALWALGVPHNSLNAKRILEVERTTTLQMATRQAFTLFRKRLNALDANIPSFRRSRDLWDIPALICERQFAKAYLSLASEAILGGKFSDGGADYVVLMTAALARYLELEGASLADSEPRYMSKEIEGTRPRILEALWEAGKGRWTVPGVGEVGVSVERGIEQRLCKWVKPNGDAIFTEFRPQRKGYTQAFLFMNSKDCEPWGPPIPFGKYSHNELYGLLTVNL